MNKKVLKSTLYPIAVLVIFFWLAIDDLIVTNSIEEFLILTQKTELTAGTITKAEAFEQEIEKENGKRMEIVYATGYEYWFNFTTSEGQVIEEKSGDYRRLPLSKDIDDIPYEVEIEYLLSNPHVNRISGVWSNNTTVFSWFKRNLMLKLIILGVCLYFSFVFMKREIKKHQMKTE